MTKFNLTIANDIIKYLNDVYKKIKSLKWWLKYPLLFVFTISFFIYLSITGYFGKSIQEKTSNLISSKKNATNKHIPNNLLIEYDSIFQEEQISNEIVLKKDSTNTSKILLTPISVTKNKEKVKIHKETKNDKKKLLQVLMEFSVNDKEGKVGYSYKNYDKIELSIEASEKPVYLLIVCIDSKGIHSINNDFKETVLIDKRIKLKYNLDQTTGFEMIYSIVSYEEFNLSDIENNLLKAYNSIKKMKGSFMPFTLKLPKQYKQSNIYFKHIKS